MDLNVGCGKDPMEGANWVNADLYPGKGVDLVFDACHEPWPLDDNSVDFLRASHVLEHLHDPHAFMRQAWRVLKQQKAPNRPNMMIAVPAGGSEAAMCDPTHVRPWHAGSFATFQMGFGESAHNPQHDSWTTPFHVLLALKQLRPGLMWLMYPWWARYGEHIINYLYNSHSQIVVYLRTLKTPIDQERFRIKYKAGTINACYYVFQHEWERRPLRDGETIQYKLLGKAAERLRLTN